ncbi:MAG: DUF1845 family protein [Tatlockia sp.]|nr:DUF1845 family protein [Tatlockia sp.]
MTTTIKLTLANAEVNRLFTRKLDNQLLFYEALMQKINALLRRCQLNQAYSLLALQGIQEAIHKLTTQCFDEIDKFEGLLEKKKHLKGMAFNHSTRFEPKVAFDSSLAADLVELFAVHDRLISTLKILRFAGCFSQDNDYFANLRRTFKSINRLLSQIQLIKINTLPAVTFEDVIDNKESYQLIANLAGEIDYIALYRAMTSNLAQRLEEKIRQPLLYRLKKKIKALQVSKANDAEVILPCA